MRDRKDEREREKERERERKRDRTKKEERESEKENARASERKTSSCLLHMTLPIWCLVVAFDLLMGIHT